MRYVDHRKWDSREHRDLTFSDLAEQKNLIELSDDNEIPNKASLYDQLKLTKADSMTILPIFVSMDEQFYPDDPLQYENYDYGNYINYETESWQDNLAGRPHAGGKLVEMTEEETFTKFYSRREMVLSHPHCSQVPKLQEKIQPTSNDHVQNPRQWDFGPHDEIQRNAWPVQNSLSEEECEGDASLCPGTREFLPDGFHHAKRRLSQSRNIQQSSSLENDRDLGRSDAVW